MTNVKHWKTYNSAMLSAWITKQVSVLDGASYEQIEVQAETQQSGIKFKPSHLQLLSETKAQHTILCVKVGREAGHATRARMHEHNLLCSSNGDYAEHSLLTTLLLRTRSLQTLLNRHRSRGTSLVDILKHCKQESKTHTLRRRAPAPSSLPSPYQAQHSSATEDCSLEQTSEPAPAPQPVSAVYIHTYPSIVCYSQDSIEAALIMEVAGLRLRLLYCLHSSAQAGKEEQCRKIAADANACYNGESKTHSDSFSLQCACACLSAMVDCLPDESYKRFLDTEEYLHKLRTACYFAEHDNSDSVQQQQDAAASRHRDGLQAELAHAKLQFLCSSHQLDTFRATAALVARIWEPESLLLPCIPPSSLTGAVG